MPSSLPSSIESPLRDGHRVRWASSHRNYPRQVQEVRITKGLPPSPAGSLTSSFGLADRRMSTPLRAATDPASRLVFGLALGATGD